MLSLNCVMVNSSDAKKLADYYGEVLQQEPEMEDKDSGFVGYLAGDCFIMFGPHDKVQGKNDHPERMICFFQTKDVEAEFERIKAIDGTTVIKEPYNPGADPKGFLATLADPDGNYFQLATPWDQAGEK